MEIGERIRHLRRLKGWSLQKVSAMVGIDRSTFGRYETGQTAIKSETMRRLAEIFDVPINYLYGLPTEADTDVVEVDILTHLPAGRLEFTEATIEGKALVPKAMVQGGQFFYVRVAGDCMAPQIPDGALALIRVQPTVENGEIAAVVANGDEATLKRVHWMADNKALLQPDNRAYPPIIVPASSVRIVGKVTQITQGVR